MKAIIGSVEQRPYRLLAEIASLRARNAELEQRLRRAEQEVEALRARVAEREMVLTTQLEPVS